MKKIKLPLAWAVLTAVLFVWVSARPGMATPNRFQFEGDLVLESEVVCSPERNPTCGPGPYSETVQVPPGVEAVTIDVYWHLWGQPEQQQTNEHSNFAASAAGEELGQLYCQDFGDFDEGAELCGSVTGLVSPGQELSLEIVHADEMTGDSSGSHYQIWVIDWIEEAATPSVTPVEETQTATPTTPATEVTPAVTATELVPTPTSTPTEPVSGPAPPGTATPTVPATEVTPAVTATELVPTPTSTPTEPVSGPAPPGTATPTAAATEVTPVVTATEAAPTPTASPTEPVSGPAPQATATSTAGPAFTSTPAQQETRDAQQALTRTPAPTATPTAGTGTPSAVLPVTGADLTGTGGAGLLWKFGLALAGLGLVAYGILREWRKE